MKRLFITTVFILFTAFLAAETVEIDIPQAQFSEKGGYVVPYIEGYELDGTGEELILPFTRMVFLSEIEKVEIVKQHKIILKAPLQKGAPLFRMSDMHRMPKMNRETIPSLSRFTFNHYSTFKRTQEQFSFDLYPIISVSEKEIIKIDRIRVHTKEKAVMPMMSYTASLNSMLILTTKYFMRESTQIQNYIDAKKADGFKVDVATEVSYGGGRLTGMKRAEKIREYLRGVYKNYDYLLIIAGTEPGGDEVPMIVTKPFTAEDPSYDQVPTDIFYAELTEDLDSSENGIYGETIDFIHFAFELIVGRIPIYGKKVADADKILERTIRFIKEKPSQAESRRKILFPATIAYYENQDRQPGMPKMDGAYVAEYIRNKVLKEPFSTKLLVEKEGLSPSDFTEEEGATYDSVLANWNEGYGTVFWMGHGMPDYSVRTIWAKDRNSNNIPETYFELESVTFVNNATAKNITHETPFLFQGSCLNGSIQDPGSLAYNFLKEQCVGVVGASQVSYGAIFPDYDIYSEDIFAYGAVFTSAVINNRIPARVLFETKERWSNSRELLVDKMETNYLGDPSLRINVAECESDSDCDDGIYCNGSEVCSEGFCEKGSDAVICPDIDDPCRTNVCDEKKKSCVISDKTDGTICGNAENLCVSGQVCMSGTCTDVDPKDCSSLDSECSQGVCDPETGTCRKAPVNDGSSCSSGSLCVTDEKCSEGSCIGTEIEPPEPKECNITECRKDEGFVYISDNSQNWEDCTTNDGKQGYCYYGVCQKKSKQEESSSSGCSALIL